MSSKRYAMQKKDFIDHNWEIMAIGGSLELRISSQSAEMLRGLLLDRGFADLNSDNRNAFFMSLAEKQSIH